MDAGLSMNVDLLCLPQTRSCPMLQHGQLTQDNSSHGSFLQAGRCIDLYSRTESNLDLVDSFTRNSIHPLVC